MKLTKLQKKTVNELIVLIEKEQSEATIDINMHHFAMNADTGHEESSPKEIRNLYMTSCCLLGLHALNSKTRTSTWKDYAKVVGIPEEDYEKPYSGDLWDALFSVYWDNNLERAKQRCLWVLANEDINWSKIEQNDTSRITIKAYRENF